jgi:predicted nucleic acid-binding protein
VSSPSHYLLDTNVISEIRRKRPEPSVEASLRTATDTQLLVSALTW